MPAITLVDVVMTVINASEPQPELVAWAGKSDGTGARWVRIGQSWDPDARKAGAQAAQRAIRGEQPRLLVVFASYATPTELVEGISEVAGDIPVIGCSTAGEIGPGLRTKEPGVVVICLGGAFAVSTAHADGLREHPREAGQTLADGLTPASDTRYRFALLLTDTFACDQQEMIRGAYGVLGPTVPLLGGGAANHEGGKETWQIHGTSVLTDSVVGAMVGTDGPIGVSVRHGWRHDGEPMVVTSSQGRNVLALDDRLALDVYLDRHSAPAGVEADPATFKAFSITRPLAVARRGDVAVRQVVGADPITRSLICASTVPKGAMAWLAVGDSASNLAATDLACADAIGQLLEVPPLALLIFDCDARRLVFGEDGTATECQYMLARAGGAPVAGFYTYGEIARIRGVYAYHNQTIVALALS